MLLYNNKDVCLRIHISYETQERMKKHINPSYVPLFNLKSNQFFSVKFEYKAFTCNYQGKKQEFSYKDIKNIETCTDGLIVYLENGKYFSPATEKHEKHNSELYDVVLFLKRRCSKCFSEIEEISYPDYEDVRYISTKEPNAKITFAFSPKEITGLLWYEYLIGEKMLVYFILIVIILLLSLVAHNMGGMVIAGVLAYVSFLLSAGFIKRKDAYVKNHEGQLYAFLYDKDLVIRLRDTDLELEYAIMKPLKTIWGLWRVKSGEFFVLTLPERIVTENVEFFDELYKRIK